MTPGTSTRIAPPTSAQRESPAPLRIWALVTLALLWATLYAGLLWAPTERTMGVYQRIFYIHVPAAIAAWCAFGVNFAGSLAYLWKRSLKADAWAVAGAEVGLALLAINLISGPIWARPIWGIWWAWDARLTLTLVIWVMYAAYLMLRQMTPPGNAQPRLAAAFAMFIAVAIPIDYMSIRWWRTQHPAPVLFSSNGYLDPRMSVALAIGMAALLSLMGLLVVVRYRQQRLANRIDELGRRTWLAGDGAGGERTW